MTNKRRKVDIGALLNDRRDFILEAIRRGGIEAMKRHIQAGVPMVGYKDGQVIHIPPEELTELLKETEIDDLRIK
ncbi:MAG: hypothetical protein LBS60_10865 [Deltaproteobacteria bacterium]|nr:hypothetical protein [Deltaproteobacteria bacterium]